MAKTKDAVELELAAIIKTARTGIRLKHSLAADREMNEVLPGIENDYYAAVAAGKPFRLKGYEL